MSPRFATIDRFENGQAVLVGEDRRERVVPRASLPPGAREGDVLDLDSGRLDPEETERRHEEIRATRERAFAGKKPPTGGDFEL